MRIPDLRSGSNRRPATPRHLSRPLSRVPPPSPPNTHYTHTHTHTRTHIYILRAHTHLNTRKTSNNLTPILRCCFPRLSRHGRSLTVTRTVSLLFNWIGYLVCFCLSRSTAGRAGALSGFGLCFVKLALLLKVGTSGGWVWAVGEVWGLGSG